MGVDLAAFTVLAALAAPPPAVLISAPDEEAMHPAVSNDGGEAAWDVLTGSGARQVRRYNLLRGRAVAPPRGTDSALGLRWTRNARKPIVNVLTDEGRWALQMGGEEPASPSAASDLHAAVSPDRSLVAFVSGRSGKGDIYVTDANRTNQSPRRLSSSALPDVAPVWSPDSASLSFVRLTERGRQLIVLTGVQGDGSAAERVAADEREGALWPSWRPDGQELAFYGRDWSVGTALYRVNPQGGGASKILSDVVPQAGGPAWLPDGDGFALIVVRGDELVAVDSLGTPTRLETGTFGHGEVRGAVIKGERTLIFTALGLAGDEGADVRHRKVYRWVWPVAASAGEDSGLPPFQ